MKKHKDFKPIGNSEYSYGNNLKDVECSICGRPMKISIDSVSGKCWKCVCDMTAKIELD